MKKLIYILSILLLAIACSSDDDSTSTQKVQTETTNPDDLDGDGVTNQQEVVDGTNPNGVCSYIESHQVYSSVSQNWKSLDCDGDGVTNENEVDLDSNNIIDNDRTYARNWCSFILENQTIDPRQNWLDHDCDRDGVTNKQEILDGTDLIDFCDFILINQDVEPSGTWLGWDCDGDGLSNGTEFEDGTDPLDSNDFYGAGNILKEIIRYNRRQSFSNNGTRYHQTSSVVNGYVFINHEFNNEGNLAHVYIDDDVHDVNIYYTYTNNQISQVTRTEQFGETYNYNVVHNGNIAYTYDGTEPEGLFTKKFTFNAQNILLSVEEFFSVDSLFYYSLQTFEYDSSFENLLSLRTEITQGYNEINEEFYPLSNYQIKEYTFNYLQEGVLNPFYQADQDIIMNIILDFGRDIYSEANSGNIFRSYGCFSKKFLSNYTFSFESNTTNYTTDYSWTADEFQQNGLPRKIITDYGVGETEEYQIYYEY